MDAFVIEGGAPLRGRLRVNGSKNAALPLLAASLLTDEPLILRDVPNLADVRNMLGLLAELGVTRQELPPFAPADEPWADGQVTLRSTDPNKTHARYEIVKTMRASICTLGPMLAKRGRATVSLPGGCAIGDRPVDLHLRGLRQLGARIEQDGGNIIATVPPGGLRGGTIFLGGAFGSTVLGTANVLCAAALAEGLTTIECAACEPEITDLANLLNAMGARVRGAGTPRISVEGVESLGGAVYKIMPDRIEAGTLMAAAAITGGDVVLDNCPVDAMLGVVYTLQCAGVRVQPLGDAAPAILSEEYPHEHGNAAARALRSAARAAHGQMLSLVTDTADPTRLDDPADPLRRSVRVSMEGRARPVEVATHPHPGYPTDLQAQLVSLLSLAEGNSVVTERIFPDRFLHVAELSRMGAKIARTGPTVVITGVERLHGARVMASDLRASAGLVLAGLAAEGTTVVTRVYHLDRGYENLEQRLTSLGARVQRTDEKELAPSEPAAV
jgi:UDP-N-acetylglucosamine 1-carboxyvinyltransferase